MKKILITGNGIFLEKNPSLNLDSIHQKIDSYFIKFADEVIGNPSSSFKKMREKIAGTNMLTLDDGFLQIINDSWSLFTNKVWNATYEEKMGQVIDKLLNYLEQKSYISSEKIQYFFTKVYESFVSIIAGIMFMSLPDDEKSCAVSPVWLKYDHHFTLNVLYRMLGDSTIYLHGMYNLKKWAQNTDYEIMRAAGKSNESDLVLFAECINQYPLSITIPMIFGKDIDQKISVLKLLKGWQKTTHPKIVNAFKRNIPYLQLEEESVENEIHIFGVSVDSHQSILEYIKNANHVIWYWYSEVDKSKLEKLIGKYPNLRIENYRNLPQ